MTKDSTFFSLQIPWLGGITSSSVTTPMCTLCKCFQPHFMEWFGYWREAVNCFCSFIILCTPTHHYFMPQSQQKTLFSRDSSRLIAREKVEEWVIKEREKAADRNEKFVCNRRSFWYRYSRAFGLNVANLTMHASPDQLFIPSSIVLVLSNHCFKSSAMSIGHLPGFPAHS